MNSLVIDKDLDEVREIIDTILYNMESNNTLILNNIFSTTPEECISFYQKFIDMSYEQIFGKYCICIIVGWVEAFRNGIEDKFKEYILSKFILIPQHFLGRYLKTYEYTFYEYGIELFGIHFSSIEDVEKVIQKHANFIAS